MCCLRNMIDTFIYGTDHSDLANSLLFFIGFLDELGHCEHNPFFSQQCLFSSINDFFPPSNTILIWQKLNVHFNLLGEKCIVLTMTQFIQKINIMKINIMKMPTSSNFKNVLACLAYQAGLELGILKFWRKMFLSVIFKTQYQNVPIIPTFWHSFYGIWCSLGWVLSLYLVTFIKNLPV